MTRKVRQKQLRLTRSVVPDALRRPEATRLHIRLDLHGRVLLSFKVSLNLTTRKVV